MKNFQKKSGEVCKRDPRSKKGPIHAAGKCPSSARGEANLSLRVNSNNFEGMRIAKDKKKQKEWTNHLHVGGTMRKWWKGGGGTTHRHWKKIPGEKGSRMSDDQGNTKKPGAGGDPQI